MPESLIFKKLKTYKISLKDVKATFTKDINKMKYSEIVTMIKKRRNTMEAGSSGNIPGRSRCASTVVGL